MRTTCNCSSKLTREHFVSRAVLERLKDFELSGLPWQKGSTAKLGPDAFVARVLCERHNQALSPLDNAAAAAFDTIARAYEHAMRQSLSRKTGYYLLSGEVLERWCLKTLLGLFYSKNAGQNDVPLVFEYDFDPADAVSALSGGMLRSPLGLYVHRDLQAETWRRVRLGPLMDDELKRLAGLRVDLNGLPLEVIVEDRTFEQTLSGMASMYRPWVLDFEGPERTARIFLTWPDRPSQVRKVGMRLQRRFAKTPNVPSWQYD